MNTTVITFTPDGSARCLYSELIDLARLGPLRVRRATRIEFNTRRQRWEVRSPTGRLLYSHRSRVVCLAWEQQRFNRP